MHIRRTVKPSLNVSVGSLCLNFPVFILIHVIQLRLRFYQYLVHFKMQKVNQPGNELDQDFSKPWEQSDVILLVDEQQFHVHRPILSLSSPVFSRMFSSDFKEKNADEISLPGKKADEIREMLLAIYPTSWKPVNESNCYFLLALAHEYQMAKLTQKCEDYLLEAVKKQQGVHVMDTLVVAQSYSLEKVLAECINKTQSLSLTEVKRHKMYEQIEPLSQRKMIELQMQKVEKEVERLRGLAAEALRHMESVVSSLNRHILLADNASGKRYVHPFRRTSNLNENMSTIQFDKEDRHICCALAVLFNPLKNLQSNLQQISAWKQL